MEKFYLVIDEEDRRFKELEPPFKQYEGKPAMQHLRDMDKIKWMRQRKMPGAQQTENDQVQLMKDIFIAIDEDGSGTMDQDELIKALLSLGLSQDITFAKRILTIFKDNKIKQQQKLVKKGFLHPDDIKIDLEFTFKDFIYLFKKDAFAE